MRTILDDAHTWFLENLVYADELAVLVVEGFKNEEPEDIRVGSHVIRDTHRLEPREQSRRCVLRFPDALAWQLVDESATTRDPEDVWEDDSFRYLQTLSKSSYLAYTLSHHGWYAELRGPVKHYRLWTESDVLDVVAHSEPIIEVERGT